jgi:hypothetical protein
LLIPLLWTIALKNLKALQDLLDAPQLLQCDYPYTQVQIPLKLRVVVLTQERKTILACPISIPWQARSSSRSCMSTEDDIQMVQNYVQWGLRCPPSRIASDHVAKVIEDNFIEDRRQFSRNSTNVSKEDQVTNINYPNEQQLHWHLDLASFMGRTLGEPEVTVEMWETVRGLDTLRRRRLNIGYENVDIPER